MLSPRVPLRASSRRIDRARQDRRRSGRAVAPPTGAGDCREKCGGAGTGSRCGCRCHPGRPRRATLDRGDRGGLRTASRAAPGCHGRTAASRAGRLPRSGDPRFRGWVGVVETLGQVPGGIRRPAATVRRPRRGWVHRRLATRTAAACPVLGLDRDREEIARRSVSLTPIKGLRRAARTCRSPGVDQGITPPICMHATNYAEPQRGGADGRDGILALQPIEAVNLEGQSAAATLGEAQTDARHRGVPRISLTRSSATFSLTDGMRKLDGPSPGREKSPAASPLPPERTGGDPRRRILSAAGDHDGW